MTPEDAGGYLIGHQMRKCRIAFVVDLLGFQEILSIPLLSAVAKARGHHVELFEFNRNPKRASASIVSYKPDIVAYSICSNEADRYLRINRKLKEHLKFFSLFGGPHPTYFPRFIEKEGVDAICRGEGDLCFPEFLDRFGTDRMYEVSNFSFKTSNGRYRENPVADLLRDFDTLPFPDRRLLYHRNYFMARSPIKMFMAGRGCPYDCAYCFNHSFNAMYRGRGPILRTKSVQYVLDEIRDVARRYPLGMVRFLDDIFGPNRKWLEEFAERYPREIALPFTCYANPNMITKSYSKLLAKAGCYAGFVAVECANEEIRRHVATRRVTNERLISACQHLKRQKIRVATFSMVGLPGETEQDMLDTIELNRRMGVDYAEASIFQPYPGTRLNEYCRNNGYLNEDDETYESQYTTTVLNGTPEFKNKVFVLHKLFAILVDHPRARWLVRLLPQAGWSHAVLSVVWRSYYAANMHRRIYASKIPWWLRLRGAAGLLLSRSRV